MTTKRKGSIIRLRSDKFGTSRYFVENPGTHRTVCLLTDDNTPTGRVATCEGADTEDTVSLATYFEAQRV